MRERLTRAELGSRPAIEVLFLQLDATLRASGYIAMSGQIIDATLVAAPRQRNTAAEKAEIKAGRIPAEWQARPAKVRHKDRDARWTVKFTKAKPASDGVMPAVDIAIPTFGYQSHVGIDRRFGLIRTWKATDAAAYEGRVLREGLLDKTNTAGAVWADTAYRSKANEAFMAENGFLSRVHRKKPPGRPMPVRTARANGAKSKVRARIEHVFAEQKTRMALFIRTVGIARARTQDRPRQHRLQCQTADRAGALERPCHRLTRAARGPTCPTLMAESLSQTSNPRPSNPRPSNPRPQLLGTGSSNRPGGPDGRSGSRASFFEGLDRALVLLTLPTWASNSASIRA